MKQVWLLVLLGSLAAAAGFGVSPPVVEATLSPGTWAGGEITVQSPEGQLRLEPRLVDWRLGPGGELEILPPGSLPDSLAPFLEVPTEPFSLNGERRVLRYRLGLPEGARGCYHAGLLLRAPATPSTEKGLSVRTRLGFLVLFFATAKGNAHPDLRLTESRYQGGRLTAWIENTGNACLHPRAVVEALDKGGHVIAHEIALEDYLLPGGVRRLEADFPLPEGAVALRLRVEAAGARPLLWEVER